MVVVVVLHVVYQQPCSMRGKKEEHRHDRRAQRPRENMTAQRGTGDAYRDPTLSRDSLYSGAVGDPVANFAA